MVNSPPATSHEPASASAPLQSGVPGRMPQGVGSRRPPPHSSLFPKAYKRPCLASVCLADTRRRRATPPLHPATFRPATPRRVTPAPRRPSSRSTSRPITTGRTRAGGAFGARWGAGYEGVERGREHGQEYHLFLSLARHTDRSTGGMAIRNPQTASGRQFHPHDQSGRTIVLV